MSGHLSHWPEPWRHALAAASAQRSDHAPGERIPNGRRNDALASALGTMRARGIGFGAMLAFALAFNLEQFEQPLLEEEVRRTVESICGYAPREDIGDARPQVVLSPNIAEMVRETAAAMAARNEDARLVNVGGLPARIIEGSGGVRTQLLTTDAMTLEVSKRVDTVSMRTVRRVEVRESTAPPKALTLGLMASTSLPFPELLGIVGTPIMAADGTLHDQPGYSPITQRFYHPRGLTLPPIPKRPTGNEVAAARDLILRVVADIPFESQADRANLAALGFEQFVRPMIDGPLPGHMVEAPEAGTGKDLAVRVTLFPFLGGEPATITEQANESEWAKLLTSIYIQAPPAIVVSNVNRPLDSAKLAVALSAPRWQDRVLGGNTTVDLPITSSMAFTANNPVLSKELTRRLVRTRLNAGVEHPWQRKGWIIPNLEAWVAAHRAELVVAYLTLARHWVAEGMPKGTAELGSYESWSRVISGILGAAGIEGLLGNVASFYESADSESEAWRGFAELWWQHYQHQPVRTDALAALARESGLLDAPSSRSFGKQISKQRGRVFGLYTIAQGSMASGSTRWALTRSRPESEVEVKQREQALAAYQSTQASKATKFDRVAGI